MSGPKKKKTHPVLTPTEAILESISDGVRLRRSAYNARTAQYLRLGYDRIAAADFVTTAAGRLTGPALDIGTGRGITAMALARQGLEVISVDIDADEQALAFQLAAEAGLKDRIHFVRMDAACLSYTDGHFGCVAVMDVLHHLKDPGLVLKETARVLKSSGIVILADFSPEGFELVARVHRDEGREHPISGATLASASVFLSERGFDVTVRLSGHQHDVIVLVKKTN